MRLLQTVPAVRGRALQLQLDAEREIAQRLHTAFPDELDEVTAAALVGALSVPSCALQVLLANPDTTPTGQEQLSERVHQATSVALRPWLG